MDDEFVHCLKDDLGKVGPRCRVLVFFPTKAAAWKIYPVNSPLQVQAEPSRKNHGGENPESLGVV